VITSLTRGLRPVALLAQLIKVCGKTSLRRNAKHAYKITVKLVMVMELIAQLVKKDHSCIQ